MTVPDAHCHLDQIEEPERALDEALTAGVGPILAVSMDARAAEAILRLREKRPGLVLAGIGLHPSRIPEISAEDQERELRRLEGLLDEADLIGEIGLDHKDAVTEEQRIRQVEALERQLGWAETRRLPVNLHSRRADRAVLYAAISFHERTGLGALMHWFTHSRKLARVCADKGVFISAGPSVLVDPAATEVARNIEETLLLIETDSPVIYGVEGSARPAWAARVLERLAGSRGADPGDLADRIQQNLAVYLRS